MTVPTNTYKFPKKLGDCIDRLIELQDRIKDTETTALAIRREYDALENYLLDTLPKTQLEGAAGKSGTIKIKRSVVPNVVDWDKVYAYIKKNDAWELLHRRISVTACKERWDNKKDVPGVETFTKVGLSVTKSK